VSGDAASAASAPAKSRLIMSTSQRAAVTAPSGSMSPGVEARNASSARVLPFQKKST
jgi:hypothetical protein